MCNAKWLEAYKVQKFIQALQGAQCYTIDNILSERDWKHSLINTFRMRVLVAAKVLITVPETSADVSFFCL